MSRKGCLVEEAGEDEAELQQDVVRAFGACQGRVMDVSSVKSTAVVKAARVEDRQVGVHEVVVPRKSGSGCVLVLDLGSGVHEACCTRSTIARA